jgi:hypothetical protein
MQYSNYTGGTLPSIPAPLAYKPGRKPGMLICTVCGRNGMGVGKWATACLHGHPYACDICDDTFATPAGVTMHKGRTHYKSINAPGGRPKKVVEDEPLPLPLVSDVDALGARWMKEPPLPTPPNLAPAVAAVLRSIAVLLDGE